MKSVIKKIRFLLTRRDKIVLGFLIAVSILVSMIELIGISAIFPFISIASNFELINTNQYYRYFYELFGFSSYPNFIIAFGGLLILFYVARSFLNIIYYYAMARFSHGRYHLIAYRLFENYMGMPYKEFVKKNSAYLAKTIINEAANLTAVFLSLMIIISEIMVVIVLYGFMLYVNWKITILATVFLLINAFLLTRTVSKKIKKAGVSREKFHKKFVETIHSTFGNFKLIKLQSCDDLILNNFSKASYGYTSANTINSTFQSAPRFFLEAIGFGLVIVIVVYVVWKYQNNLNDFIPVISMFILALYRLMPSASRILNGYNSIMYYQKSLDVVHNDLMYDSENYGDKNIEFSKKIELNSIRFFYEEKHVVLDDISLTINKNEKIAFVGESGSGKSTLVDLIIGIYRPVSGNIEIDGEILSDENIVSWRKKIGYIPQSVYLFDGTVAENVVFGREYDKKRVISVLKQAQIYDFLESKNGLNTLVGDGGIMLSGGQKQRIAIARALYGNPDVLVLDEATSALDSETEEKIMDEIYEISKDKTLIIIAHRLSTVQKCQKVYDLTKIKEAKNE